MGDLSDMTSDITELQGGNADVLVMEASKGVLPQTYTVPNLDTGVSYAVRVAANNALGLGEFSTDIVTEYPRGPPSAPELLHVDVALHVDEVQSITTGATHKDEIQRITTTANDVKEVQRIVTTATSTISDGTLSFTFTRDMDGVTRTASTKDEKHVVTITATNGPILVGGFTLVYNGESTNCLDFDSTEAEIKTELEGLGATPTVDVFRTGSGDQDSSYGYTYTIIPKTPDTATLTIGEGPGAIVLCDQWIGGADHSVVATVLDPVGVDLSYQMTADELKAELEKLPTIDSSVHVQRSLADEYGGYQWTVAFREMGGNLPNIVCDGFSLNSNAASCGVNPITDGNEIGGSFYLTFDNKQSAALSFDATAAAVESAIEALGSNEHLVTVTREGPSVVGGYTWSVTFVSDVGDLGMMEATSSLTGSGSTITIEEVQKGNWLKGEFHLTLAGITTTAIPYDADETTFKTIIEGMSNVYAADVSVSVPDTQLGRTWKVTFVSSLNPGDIPMFVPTTTALIGDGASVLVREVTKGSEATGEELKVTFNGPMSDGGESPTKYRVEIDTVNTFDSGLAEWYELEDVALLYEVQQVTVEADPVPEIVELEIAQVSEIQHIVIDTANVAGGEFVVTYGGRKSSCIAVGEADTDVVADAIDIAVQAVLVGAGAVTVSATATGYTVTFDTTDPVYQLSFGADFGTSAGCAVDITCNSPPCPADLSPWFYTEMEPMTGNFELEFTSSSCTNCFFQEAVQTTASVDVALPTVASDLETALNALSNIKGGGVKVTKTDHTGAKGHGFSLSITFVGGAVQGDMENLAIAAGHTVTSTAVVQPVLTLKTINNGEEMSGQFSVAFDDEVTNEMPHDVSAEAFRDELESLPGIDTVSVSRDWSKTILPGTVSVTNGGTSLTTSQDLTDLVHRGDMIYLLGQKFRVAESGTFDATTVPLGSVNNYELSDHYSGVNVAGVSLYKHSAGYTWSVTFLRYDQASSLQAITVPRDSLAPASAAVAVHLGESFLDERSGKVSMGCNGCFYIPNLVMNSVGGSYYVRIHAANSMGYNTVSGNVIAAKSMQLPGPPQNVHLSVISSTSLLVELEPPASDGGDTITGYIAEYDTAETFNSNADNTGPLGTSEIGISSIQGLPPYFIFISGLSTGVRYYVRVSAINSVGKQIVDPEQNPPNFGYNTNWQKTTPESEVTADQVPLAPFDVDVSYVSGSIIRTITTSPGRDGGIGLLKFKIEWDTSVEFNTKNGLPLCSTEEAIPSSNLVELSEVPNRWVYDIGGITVNHLYTGEVCDDLIPGTPYYVRVAAFNGVGVGDGGTGYGTYFTTVVPIAPKEIAAAPTNVLVSSETEKETTIQELTVSWSAPTSDGGSPISNYKIEWFTPRRRYEVQTVTIENTVAGQTSGTFAIAFMNDITSAMSHDISAEDFRYHLMHMAADTITDAIHVEREAIASRGYKWHVTFIGNLNNGDLYDMVFIPQGDLSEGTGTLMTSIVETQAGIRDGTNNGKEEIQKITSAVTGGVAKGFFRLSIGGVDWSPLINHDATEEQMIAALETIPYIGLVDVSRTDVSVPDETFEWLITFLTPGQHTGYNIPALVADTTYLLSNDNEESASITIVDGDNSLPVPGVTAAASDSAPICPTCAIGETPDGYGYATVAAGVSEYTYEITNLEPGVEYIVRVSAGNEVGYGQLGVATPSLIAPALQSPNPPQNVQVNVSPGGFEELLVSFDAPDSDGGSEVLKYQIQWDSSPGFENPSSQPFEVRCPNYPIHQVNTIETQQDGATGAMDGGGFELSLQYNGNTATLAQSLPFDAVALAEEEQTGLPRDDIFCLSTGSCAETGSMQSYLNYLADQVGLTKGVDVERRAGTDAGTYVWSITFLDDVSGITISTPANDLDNSAEPGATKGVSIQNVHDAEIPGECTGTHLISNLETGLMYYFRVFSYNKIGYSRAANAAAPMKPMRAPDPPTDVKLEVVSGTQLRVSFSNGDDGGDTITKYMIEWDTASSFDSGTGGGALGTKEHLHLDGGAPFRVTIPSADQPSLTMGVYYYVRVAAYNSQGYGAFELSSPVKEKPMQIPSAATGVRLLVTSDTMLTVTFEEPMNNGGDDIQEYQIEWDRDPSFTSNYALPHKGVTAVNATIDRSYTISNLIANTAYYVRVAASNSLGYGIPQESTPKQVAPSFQVPGKPSNIVLAASDGQIDVSWDAPIVPDHGVSCAGGGPEADALGQDALCPTGMGTDHGGANGYGEADGGHEIQNYYVQYDKEPDFTSNTQITTTGNSYSITGLTNGRLYYIRVGAVSSIGNGQFCSSGGIFCDGVALTATPTP